MIWHPASYWKSKISIPLHAWLFDATSLTQRLQAQCQAQFFVEVLDETWGISWQDEQQALNLTTSTTWLRHVHLNCREHPWVFARTVIPHSTLVDEYRSLIHLGTQPLGEVLFSFHALQRTEIEAACLSEPQPLYQLASVHLHPKPKILWARRSVFYLPENKPLLVQEVFLPQMLNWLEISPESHQIR